MTVRSISHQRAYLLLTIALVALIACVVYFDRSGARRPFYASCIVGVFGLVYNLSCIEAGRYMGRGGSYVTKADHPERFARSVRLTFVASSALIGLGLLFLAFV